KGLRVRAWPADPRSVHLARRGGRLPLHGCAGRPPVAHPVFGAPGGRGGRERPPVEARGALPRQVLRREGRGGGGAGRAGSPRGGGAARDWGDRKSTRLNSSHVSISYAVFCLKKKSAR